MAYGQITDRSTGAGDRYIVTGSIGPQFQPQLFTRKRDASKYARGIIRTGKAEQVWPEYSVVIEDRWREQCQL